MAKLFKMGTYETDPILAFFAGSGTDHAGRQHADILAWPDHQLETAHDYIQWLFPLRSPSHYNPDAPVLQAGAIDAFANDPQLRRTLLRGLWRMTAFYGFSKRTFPNGGIQLDPIPDFQVRGRAWLTPNNHNYLRLTRILTSLSVLTCQDEAEALFDVLGLVYRRNRGLIEGTTYAFWKSAVGF